MQGINVVDDLTISASENVSPHVCTEVFCFLIKILGEHVQSSDNGRDTVPISIGSAGGI